MMRCWNGFDILNGKQFSKENLRFGQERVTSPIRHLTKSALLLIASIPTALLAWEVTVTQEGLTGQVTSNGH